jgi:hypothetical protein
MKYSALIIYFMLSGYATTALENQPKPATENIKQYTN